jgi:hypothetical protein
MSADTLARNADKIDTFRRPRTSAGVRDQSSHGENIRLNQAIDFESYQAIDFESSAMVV